MTNASRLFTTLYLVISIGATWAAMASDRVSYPAWAMVGPHEFGAFHHVILIGTQTYLIPPALLSLAMTIAMFWLRHRAISKVLVGFVLLLQLVGAFATVGLAVPLQVRMLHGPASAIPSGIAALIAIDFYWRIIPGALSLIAFGLMIYKTSNAPKGDGKLAL